MNKVLIFAAFIIGAVIGFQPQKAEALTPILSFITITSPTSGDTLTVGETHRITWNSSPDITHVTIMYKSCVSCSDYVSSSLIPNTGYYDWNVKIHNTTQTEFQIWILGYSPNGTVDGYSQFFTIEKEPEFCDYCMRVDKSTYYVGDIARLIISGVPANTEIEWAIYFNDELIVETEPGDGGYTDWTGSYTEELDFPSEGFIGTWEIWAKIGHVYTMETFTVQATPVVAMTVLGPTYITVNNGEGFGAQFSVNGGQAPYTWSVVPSTNSIPGLYMNAQGALQSNGPVYGIGTYSVTIKATDVYGKSAQTTILVAVTGNQYTLIGTNFSTSDGTVWFVNDKNCRSAYTSAGAFLSYGYNSWSSVISATSALTAVPICNTNQGFTLPREGKILCSDRGSDYGTCYLISNGQKHGFTSEQVFTSLGYSFNNVTRADLSWMSRGLNISDPYSAHLPGTLINNNGTVQLVTNNGMLSFPSAEIFSSWGYTFAEVVESNPADRKASQVGLVKTKSAGQLNPQ